MSRSLSSIVVPSNIVTTDGAQVLRNKTVSASENALQGVDLGSLSGTLAVSKGGMGTTTLPANNLLVGNGTGAVQHIAPGGLGAVLTSDGSAWTAVMPAPLDNYVDVGSVNVATTISLGNTVNEITLTADVALVFTGAISGTPLATTLIVNQDATGGRTITWPATAKYAGGVAPPQSTGANDVDIWSIFTVDGGATLFVSLAVKDAG